MRECAWLSVHASHRFGHYSEVSERKGKTVKMDALSTSYDVIKCEHYLDSTSILHPYVGSCITSTELAMDSHTNSGKWSIAVVLILGLL